MANHDGYGKQVLRQAVGSAFDDAGASIQINYLWGGLGVKRMRVFKVHRCRGTGIQVRSAGQCLI